MLSYLDWMSPCAETSKALNHVGRSPFQFSSGLGFFPQHLDAEQRRPSQPSNQRRDVHSGLFPDQVLLVRIGLPMNTENTAGHKISDAKDGQSGSGGDRTLNLHASADLEQPVKEDDAVQLVLRVSLPDDERQRDGGRQFVAAVGLGEARLSEGGTSGGNKICEKAWSD